jgi:hypothetical protein
MYYVLLGSHYSENTRIKEKHEYVLNGCTNQRIKTLEFHNICSLAHGNKKTHRNINKRGQIKIKPYVKNIIKL